MLAALLLLALATASTLDKIDLRSVDDAAAGCENNDNTIACCAGVDLDVWIIDIDLSACAEITLDWDTLDVTVELTINDATIISTTFGLGHEPELCAELLGMSICLSLTDMELDDWNFSGCVSIVINDKSTIDLGCWDTEKTDN